MAGRNIICVLSRTIRDEESSIHNFHSLGRETYENGTFLDFSILLKIILKFFRNIIIHLDLI